jgi:hypothetical protein
MRSTFNVYPGCAPNRRVTGPRVEVVEVACAESWWVGLDRAAFQAKAAERLEVLRVAKMNRVMLEGLYTV